MKLESINCFVILFLKKMLPSGRVRILLHINRGFRCDLTPTNFPNQLKNIWLR